ncbi:MAG: hypothetical protein WCB44_19635 [Stellaceae bacterium]
MPSMMRSAKLGVLRADMVPQYPVCASHAMLVLPREFFDQLHGPRIARGWIGPVGFCSHRFAVHFGGHGATDHIDILLGERDVRFPGRQQLSLGRGSYYPDDLNKRFEWQ